MQLQTWETAPVRTPLPWAAFGRRYREASEATGETQAEAGARIGKTQAYVSQLFRGAARPSFQLLNRIIAEYELEGERETLWRLCGYGPQPGPEDEQSEITRRIAREVLEEAGHPARPPIERLVRAAEEILNAPPDTEYETVWDGPAYGFDGYISQHDREVIKQIMEALIAERRRKQGR